MVWLGGWRPEAGYALGIPLVVDGAAMALGAFAALVAACCLIGAVGSLDSVGGLAEVLVLLLVAGSVGFVSSGDLFDLFVFGELLSVSAFPLVAYQVGHPAPLQAGMNFAVIESVGTTLMLLGIGSLYACTGTLDLAGIGRALAQQHDARLVAVSGLLIGTGLLVQAAAFPFHFAHADAETAAPAAILPLLAGVLLPFGDYALARIYWTAFGAAPAVVPATLREVLLGAAVATCAVGSFMCWRERQLKRLLAFASIAHGGIVLAGLGLLDPHALAGAGLYLLADGAVLGALFLVVGALLHRFGRIDEQALGGFGRHAPALVAALALGGLALGGLPPFGTALGKGWIEEAARTLGFGWLEWFLVAVSAVTGGAVLRACGRIALGPAGRDERAHGGRAGAQGTKGGREEAGEAPEEGDGAGLAEPESRLGAATLLTGAVILLALALSVGAWPPARVAARSAAGFFTDRHVYAGLVLDGRAALPLDSGEQPLAGVATGALGAAGALALAAITLFAAWHRRGRSGSSIWWRWSGAPGRFLRAFHTGHIGDYVTWLLVGLLALGLGWWLGS